MTSSVQTQLDGKASAASPTFTGAIASALGSAAAPSYSFTGDSNTGVWSSGPDTVNVSTGGSERLKVTSAGHVGIGTTNPSQTLSIVGSGHIVGTFGVGAVADSNAGQLRVYANSVNSALRADQVGSGPVATFIGGNVGIGTSSPSAKLHVVGGATKLDISLKLTPQAVPPWVCDAAGVGSVYMTKNGVLSECRQSPLTYTQISSSVAGLAYDSGSLYAIGSFTSIAGTTVNSIAKWNGSTWASLGSGLNHTSVSAIKSDGSGNLYVGGHFTESGGVSAVRVAKWDGSSWSALGGGANNGISALATDGAGNLYAGGAFTSPGSRIAKWDGSSWGAMGTGMDNSVSALAADGSGNIYAGGTFTTAGSVTVNYVAKWDGSSWSALGSGMNGNVRALAWDGSGNLYAGGAFTMAGGILAPYIAKWDGTSWSALGTGMNNSVEALAFDGSGNLYAGGTFTEAGGILAARVAKWNGTSWSALRTGVSGAVRSLVWDGSSSVYFGGDFYETDSSESNFLAKWTDPNWTAFGGAGTISTFRYYWTQ